MTELNKPIARRTKHPFSYYRRRLVATLEPGDLISLRLERSRQAYRITLVDLYWILLRNEVLARRLEKAREAKRRKKAKRR